MAKSKGERKQPKQARSINIVNAIVAAARKILEEEGREALNTNYIAEVAGVNIASLYRWFSGKEEIIESSFEALVAEEIDVLVDLLQQDFEHDITVVEALSYVIDTIVQRQLRFLRLDQDFFRKNLPSFDVGSRCVLDTDLTWVVAASEWLADVIAKYHPEFSAAQCKFKAFLATRSIQGCCLSASTDNPEYLEHKSFKPSLYDLALHCIYSEAAGTPDATATFAESRE